MTAGSTLNFAAAYDQVYRQDSCTKPQPIVEQNALQPEDYDETLGKESRQYDCIVADC